MHNSLILVNLLPHRNRIFHLYEGVCEHRSTLSKILYPPFLHAKTPITHIFPQNILSYYSGGWEFSPLILFELHLLLCGEDRYGEINFGRKLSPSVPLLAIPPWGGKTHHFLPTFFLVAPIHLNLILLVLPVYYLPPASVPHCPATWVFWETQMVDWLVIG